MLTGGRRWQTLDHPQCDVGGQHRQRRGHILWRRPLQDIRQIAVLAHGLTDGVGFAGGGAALGAFLSGGQLVVGADSTGLSHDVVVGGGNRVGGNVFGGTFVEFTGDLELHSNNGDFRFYQGASTANQLLRVTDDNGNEQALGEAGTAAFPYWSYSGDTNTGHINPNPDEVGVVNGATHTWSFLPSGALAAQGGVRLVQNVADAIADTDAVNLRTAQTLVDGLRWKQPARAIETSSNITLSGLQTIDTVLLADGDRVLLIAQSTGSENGLWIVRAAAWERPTDFDTGELAANASIWVSEGSQQETRWVCTNDSGSHVIDTDRLFCNRQGIHVGPQQNTRFLAGTNVSDNAVSARTVGIVLRMHIDGPTCAVRNAQLFQNFESSAMSQLLGT